ncbi:MAG TPA: arginine--tRNA ligase [Burkholderiales bacterium]|nr:arginine--tRNA ligase [Burkholderiales bacterium]
MSNAPALDLRSHFTGLLRSALVEIAPDAANLPLILERPKSAQHGDYACSVAMQLAKPMKRNPRDIAQALVKALPQSPYLEKAEIAGAGFVNLYLKPAAKQQILRLVLQQRHAYGRVDVGGGRKVQVEFVSANPTGPLHVGHGRGAAYGASLASLLEAAGFAVTREYYVNDAGRQMDILALSTWLRYVEIAGARLEFPANAYQGDYVRDMARQIFEAHGKRYLHPVESMMRDAPPAQSDPEARLDYLIASAKRVLGPDYDYVHDFVLAEQLGDCRKDLQEFGVTFDSWFSEKSLFDSGLVVRAVEQLQASGHVYRKDGARWFRSTVFGDEKDRVVQRDNGQFTYFASDIAYHLNKFQRGFDLLVNVWGADHHGYIARVKGALQALRLDPAQLTIALVQFAVLYRDGKKVSMSTRAGEFVTLRELRSEVGNDAARFFYVLRKSDQHLDFDLDLAKSQSNDNPVYYIQYAHARVCSVLEQWGGDASTLVNADPGPLVGEQELEVLQKLLDYPETIESAARDLAPHQLAFYLKELAAAFHSYYNSTRVLVDDESIRLARLALANAVRQVLANGLAILGVSAPEKM